MLELGAGLSQTTDRLSKPSIPRETFSAGTQVSEDADWLRKPKGDAGRLLGREV